MSYEWLDSHQKGKAVGREEGPKQQIFSGPEWFHPFWVGNAPSPTSSKPCVGSHTALQLWRENKTDSQSTDLSPFCRAAAGQAAWGLWCPSRGQGLSEPLCGAPRSRCSGSGPWEDGTGQGTTVPGHQQECQFQLLDPEGTCFSMACSRDFPTHQQFTRPPSNSQGGASKHSWSNGSQ